MEPISFAASLLTLTSTTSSAVKFFRALQDAPSELERLRQEMQNLRSALDLQLQFNWSQVNLHAPNKPPFLDREKLKDFESQLRTAKSCLQLIEQSLANYPDKPNKIVCGRWVLRHRTEIFQLVKYLYHIEQTTMSVMMILSTSVTLGSYSCLNDINLQQKQILKQLKETQASICTQTLSAHLQPGLPRLDDLPLPGLPQIPKAQTQRALVNVHRAKYSYNIIGKMSNNTCHVVFQSQRDELQRVHKVSGRVRPPFGLLAYTLGFEAEIKFSVLHWPLFSQSISLKNIVSVDSAFLRACNAGDYETARSLATAGQGSPTDIDQDGQPALHRAIKGGSYWLVRILLDHGANANENEGILLESPLQVACKFGLIDIGGFTAIVSLWQQRSLSFPRAEFLMAMLAYSPLPIQPANDNFWNPAFQIATQGYASDMELLIHLGAAIHDLDCNKNNIMRYCIIGSNIETFDYLADFMPANWFRERDHRGMTALHQVFCAPNPFAYQLARRLINFGADIDDRDGRGLTIGDIAKETDKNHKGHYVWKTGTCNDFDAWQKTIRSLGYDVELDNEGDVFWPAAQGL